MEELVKEVKELRKDFTAFELKVSVQVGKLMVKSGIWGAIGAAIPICIGLIIWLTRKNI